VIQLIKNVYNNEWLYIYIYIYIKTIILSGMKKNIIHDLGLKKILNFTNHLGIAYMYVRISC